MKDKETKEVIWEMVVEFLTLPTIQAKEQLIEDIFKLEQEAERRGYERGAEQLRKDITNRVIVGLVGDDDKLYKLKLLEEENGKQNAR